MASVGAFLRLLGAGWTLVRNDALLPRELDGVYSPGVRALADGLRMFATDRGGRPGERLARSLQGLGPVAIKLGQLLSTRGDIFGRVFAEDMGHLKDRLPPFPLTVARAEVERELGRPIGALFATFGEPVAAASLAQAHDATLLDGRRVAVKVLRPGIDRRVAEDSEVLALAARLIERLAPLARRLEPVKLADTVIRATELELDLRLEAAGADELAEVMALDGYMAAPKVVWDGVGKRCLTMEWAQGMPLSDDAALEQPGLDRKALADNLTRAFLAQALDHGVFHADLHEGNLFAAAPDRIHAVDFGIIGRLGVTERRYLAEILWGFLSRDYDRISRVHFEAGYVPPEHSVEAFAQALRAVGEPVIGKAASQVSMGRLLGQLFEITDLFDMHLRPELILLQKTMVSVEGVARRLNPDHDLWAAAAPVVERWIRRELGPQAQVRDAVEEIRATLKALSRLAMNPPQTQTVVIREAHTPAWLVVCVTLALTAAAAALVLSLWPAMV